MKRTPTHEEIMKAQDKARAVLQEVRAYANSLNNKIYEMDCDVSQDELYDTISELQDRVNMLIGAVDKAEDEIELALLKESN